MLGLRPWPLRGSSYIAQIHMDIKNTNTYYTLMSPNIHRQIVFINTKTQANVCRLKHIVTHTHARYDLFCFLPHTHANTPASWIDHYGPIHYLGQTNLTWNRACLAQIFAVSFCDDSVLGWTLHCQKNDSTILPYHLPHIHLSFVDTRVISISLGQACLQPDSGWNNCTFIYIFIYII